MPTKKTSAGSTPSTSPNSPASPAAPRAPKRQAKARNGNGGVTAVPAIASASDRKTTPSNEPTREQIAEAAYLRYLQRGGSHGQDFNDWLEAERELKSRR